MVVIHQIGDASEEDDRGCDSGIDNDQHADPDNSQVPGRGKIQSKGGTDSHR